LIEIGSKTAEKNCTNKQTGRHYENNGHLAVNQLSELFCAVLCMTVVCNDMHAREQFRFSFLNTMPMR